MVSSESRNKIVEDALKQVDFNVILDFYLKMNIEYPYGGILNIQIIQNDLRKALHKIITETKWETQDGHWLIYYDPHSIEDSALHIQIHFTPFSSHIYHFKKEFDHKDKLQQKLDQALQEEDYLLASKIKKTLENF